MTAETGSNGEQTARLNFYLPLDKTTGKQL